jgi:hypothetical protein
VVSVTDPYGLVLGFLDRSCYVFFKVAPHLDMHIYPETVAVSLWLVNPLVDLSYS